MTRWKVSIGELVAIGSLMGAMVCAAVALCAARTSALEGVLEDPEDLHTVWECDAARKRRGYGTLMLMERMKARTDVFEGVAAVKDAGKDNNFILTSGTTTVRLDGAKVTPSLFNVLGARLRLGPGFDENGLGAGPDQAILSHRVWKTHFGSDPDIVGSRIDVPGYGSPVVVGVLGVEQTFRYDPTQRGQPRRFDVWIRLSEIELRSQLMESAYRVIARLRPEIDAASAEDILRDETQRVPHICLTPLEEDGATSFNRAAQKITFTGTTALLVLATANFILCLLAIADREHSLAIRQALGASPARALVPVFRRVVLLVVASVLGGSVLAYAALRGLELSATAGLMERQVTPRALLMSLAAATTASLVLVVAIPFGYRAFRRERLLDGLAVSPTMSTNPLGRRTWHRLLAAQVACAVALLVPATRLWRSLVEAIRTPVGVQIAERYAARMSLPRVGLIEAEAMIVDLRQRLEANGSHESFAMASRAPFFSGGGSTVLRTEDGLSSVPTALHWISPEFFDTLGIPVEGRSLDGGPYEVVINESLDAALFSDAGLDRSFQYGEQRLLVVGVADDVREGGPDSEPEPSLYLPLGSEVFYNPILLWSSSAGEVHIRNELERVAHEVHPHITIENFGSFRRFLHEATAPRRFRALIGGVLAGVSLLVSVGGAWGVSRFLMIKRGREVGIRLALGARPRSVERHLLSDTATSVAFGALGGLILALWLIPFIAASLPEFAPLSGATDYIFAVAAVTLPVLAAAWSVARKIARHAVSVALRTE